MKISTLIAEQVESGQANNQEMVEAIQQLSIYLGLISPKDYARQRGIKFQSVYKSRKAIEILGRKWIIDNY
jgi:hypothetical protein